MKHTLLLWLIMAISVLPALAQTRTIKGKVTDAKDGSAVPYATVRIHGSNKGTATDQNGNFSIELGAGQTLVISSVGFGAQTVKPDQSGSVNVSLAADNTLTEYIATGYVNTNRVKKVSAVAEVTAEKLANTPLVDINQALQGQAAGVFVGGASGQPGSVQNVRIRGVGSISASAAPLYVIDGIIVDGRDVNNTSNLALQSNDLLANLNPNDVESINVLKDASATAMYGSRGANGVIVITTKKGKAGVTTFGARAQYGSSKASFGKSGLLTPAESLAYNRDVLALNGYTPAEIDEEFPASLLSTGFDWRDAGFRTAKMQDYGISASGGNEKTKLYLSAGYNDQEGTVINSGLKRYTLISNVSQKVNDRLDVSTNLNLSQSDANSAMGGNYYASPLLGAFFVSPFQSPYKPDGSLYTGLEADFNAASGDNFLYSIYRNDKKLSNFRGLGGVTVAYRIFDWLKVQEKVNLDMVNSSANLFYDPTTGDGYNAADPLKSGSIYNQSLKATTLTNQFSFTGNFNIGEDHQLDYLALTEYNRFKSRSFNAEGIGIIGSQLKVLDITATPQAVGGNATDYTFLSYMGQLNYSFRQKYNLSVGARTDGSSRFGVNNRYGTFFSVGASWRLIEEGFMQSQNAFSDLKLRVSYGQTGNADFGTIDNFVARALYDYGTSYNGAPGNAPNTIGNVDLTWEKNKSFNIGLDLALLNGAISATIDVYKRNTDGLLLNTPVSSTSGFTTQMTNVGSLENKGIEALITSKNFDDNNGFSWRTELNIGMNRNKVTSLFMGRDVAGANSTQLHRVGQPVQSWYLNEWAGVDPKNGDPLWYTADGKTTNNINLAERRIVGNSQPKFTGGLTNTFEYKGISLSVFFYAVTGNKILNRTRNLGDADGAYFGYGYDKLAAQNYWRKEGDIAERPKPIPGGNKNANSALSTRYLEDGSFLRLRNINLAYSLPAKWVRAAKLSSVKLYAQAANLATWTSYTGWDPEQDISALEFFRYPPSKSITFGANINF
ncbi:SusC/RagA family TonB-linked outer membrane protein [Chitinophaga agri]|uniref:TonB-dependent receptor n=1 Tax=Chitinophaga agri TaxID=2703787 RepID=A0A6B9ZK04_9BACT|nr:TonB-dependent receptor [Chitinophaga agri]QHS61405.1 TonB-dependent receptor [Chitinophaga agri]